MQTWQLLLKRVFQPVSKTSVKTVIDLLRHGDVQGGRKYRGQLDDPLSELGWKQLRSTTNKKQNWQHIITSPLKRCADFADELAQKHELPLRTEPEFKEVSFGLWEGKTAEELLTTEPGQIKEYWNDPVNITPPQGENLLVFQQRVISRWENVLTEFQGKHILIISHGDPLWLLDSWVRGLDNKETLKDRRDGCPIKIADLKKIN